MIRAVRGGFVIISHTTGKRYPKVYPTIEAARKRIAQMLKFREMRGGKK